MLLDMLRWCLFFLCCGREGGRVLFIQDSLLSLGWLASNELRYSSICLVGAPVSTIRFVNKLPQLNR